MSYPSLRGHEIRYLIRFSYTCNIITSRVRVYVHLELTSLMLDDADLRFLFLGGVVRKPALDLYAQF